MTAILAVYAAGLLQGLALVTFPAASGVLTSASGYGLSTAEYGAMFSKIGRASCRERVFRTV